MPASPSGPTQGERQIAYHVRNALTGLWGHAQLQQRYLERGEAIDPIRLEHQLSVMREGVTRITTLLGSLEQPSQAEQEQPVPPAAGSAPPPAARPDRTV